MSKTSLQDLREHMFDVIERLKESGDPECDPKDSITVEKAEAICNAASKIIDAAKVEAELIKTLVNNGAGLDRVPTQFLLKS